MNDQQQLSVPLEPMLAVVEEQRNQALTSAAQWQAVAREVMAERDRLAAEMDKFRPTGAE